jgi:hypothetical protein
LTYTVFRVRLGQMEMPRIVCAVWQYKKWFSHVVICYSNPLLQEKEEEEEEEESAERPGRLGLFLLLLLLQHWDRVRGKSNQLLVA